MIGIWHQVEALSVWTGLSVGALGVLAMMVYLDPKLLKLAIVAAIGVVAVYVAEIHGNLIGLADGRAEVQSKWDAQTAAAAAARAAALERQAELAEKQRAADAANAARLAREAKDAEAAIAAAPAKDDGPVPKVLLDSWKRARAARGLK